MKPARVTSTACVLPQQECGSRTHPYARNYSLVTSHVMHETIAREGQREGEKRGSCVTLCVNIHYPRVRRVPLVLSARQPEGTIRIVILRSAECRRRGRRWSWENDSDESEASCRPHCPMIFRPRYCGTFFMPNFSLLLKLSPVLFRHSLTPSNMLAVTRSARGAILRILLAILLLMNSWEEFHPVAWLSITAIKL